MSANQQDNHNFESPYQNTGFDAEFAQPPRTRRSGGCCFFGCCLGCLGFLLLIAIGFFAFWYCLMSGGAELIVSEETTVITEPLKSDGKTVDFFRAIQEMTEPAIPASENGFRDVLLAFGREIFDDSQDAEWRYLATCEALEIDPQEPPQEAVFDDKNLDIVRAAVSGQHYFVPKIRQNEKDLVETSLFSFVWSFHEGLHRALQERAESRFDGGNITEAWKDTLASLRLFRLVSTNRLEANVLVAGRQHELLALHFSDVVSTLPKWTPEQLIQAIKDLESLPNGQDRQTMLKMMQFMLLDVISATNDPGGLLQSFFEDHVEHEMLQAMTGMFHVIAFDWNLVAKELNSKIRDFGELMKRAEGMSLDEQFELLQLSEAEGLDEEKIRALLEDYVRTTGDFPLFTSGRSRLAGVIAGGLMRAAARTLYQLQLMEESRCQALRLALALELYRREHQNYPDSLDALGLKAMPVNVSLEYEKRDAGYRIHNRVFELER